MKQPVLAPAAERDLHAIWYYVARESGSADIADRLIDAITERFFLLSCSPFIGRSRDDLHSGFRSFPLNNYSIFYRVDDKETVTILRVLHGSRHIDALLIH